MMTPPTPRFAQPVTASRMPARGIASAAQSTPSGKSAADFRHGRPLISLRVALTRWISPRKAKRSILASRLCPSAPGVADAPTMAIERGRGIRSIALRAGAGAGSADDVVTGSISLLTPRNQAGGVDLTFATHLTASSARECQIETPLALNTCQVLRF